MREGRGGQRVFGVGGGKMAEKYYWKGYVRVMEGYVSGEGDW